MLYDNKLSSLHNNKNVGATDQKLKPKYMNRPTNLPAIQGKKVL